MKQFELVCCIVNDGNATQTLRLAKKHGVHGGTILMARGTAHTNKLLDYLELTDSRKEIVIMVTEHHSALETMEFLSHELSFHKRSHGICFSFPLNDIIGVRNLQSISLEHQEAVKDAMYNAIFTIVDKGQAEEVVAAATQAGARGGTIIGARGSGIHETRTVFAMEIEPEREVVLILVESKITDAVKEAIRAHLHLDDPAKGILFVIGVTEAHGLYSGK